jgi:hypothetical protein
MKTPELENVPVPIGLLGFGLMEGCGYRVTGVGLPLKYKFITMGSNCVGVSDGVLEAKFGWN